MPRQKIKSLLSLLCQLQLVLLVNFLVSEIELLLITSLNKVDNLLFPSFSGVLVVIVFILRLSRLQLTVLASLFKRGYPRRYEVARQFPNGLPRAQVYREEGHKVDPCNQLRLPQTLIAVFEKQRVYRPKDIDHDLGFLLLWELSCFLRPLV